MNWLVLQTDSNSLGPDRLEDFLVPSSGRELRLLRYGTQFLYTVYTMLISCALYSNTILHIQISMRLPCIPVYMTDRIYVRSYIKPYDAGRCFAQLLM